MINGQSEQLNQIKRAMKIHEIVSSDKDELIACKSDLMRKVAMNEEEAEEVATSIRDMFLPKLLKSEGLDEDDMPEDFIGKMTDDDDNFDEEYKDEDRDELEEEDEEIDFSEDDEDYEDDAQDDDDEVGEDEIATIHITVPADKIRDVEKALESVLGDTDAQSKDHAMGHNKENPQGEKNMNNKEARKALRKTILASIAEEDVDHVKKTEGFDHDNSEQYTEETFYDTASFGGAKDPDVDTLNYADIEIPNFTTLVDGLKPDLGLKESLKTFKFDGTPTDAADFELDFNPFEIPSQGNQELYEGKGPKIPSEMKIPMKKTVNASQLGEFDADAAEEALAFALRQAGVEDEDLGKLTYAEGLDLFKAIKTASEDRKHYTQEGVMNNENGFVQNTDITDPDKEATSKKETMATTEDQLEEEHHAKHASTDDQYVAMLRKLMKGASYAEKDEEEDMEDKAENKLHVDDLVIEAEEKMAKEAELYKARLKTAYSMTTKLATAGILPAHEADSLVEGWLQDGLTVKAMIKQTQLMLNSAAAHAEKYAASSSSVRTASSGIAFNPSVRGASADLSGASEIQNALKNLGWSTPKVTGMEE